ncbi:BCD family MFS transporter [Methylopila turkensis]|uniref:MFS transporter n=1 Tax=Methylopila turkensis TaxID=1437816 RepID=A0A9W6JM98_9HYPH|nr:BCD family MFS transporter [Methylopila turkensis]GLK78289.1 MFS transporter [Methylopila turkensis]
MISLVRNASRFWVGVGSRYMPFADAATEDLPLGKLLRLSLFQVSVGFATVLLVGTLNRVMIVELGVPAALVAVMVALPLLVTPVRAVIGFRSDHHRSAFGWKRVPYIWFGTLLQFGGLAIMPFALLVLGMDKPPFEHGVAVAAAGLAFLLVGAGLQTTQTAGLALASDLASEQNRPRVVALMYVVLLGAMVASGLVYSLLLADFREVKLIQVIQGSAVVTVLLNVVAMWKMEPRNRAHAERMAEISGRPSFWEAWGAFTASRRSRRFLGAVALGTGAFMMQDIVLEPYGGQVLGLTVAGTSALTALLALGALIAFTAAARALVHGYDPLVIASFGAVVGLPAFVMVTLAGPLDSPALFRIGVGLVGFGGGLFSIGTLTAAMGMEDPSHTGLALGAWGAVSAAAGGAALGLGGVIRDLVADFGPAGQSPFASYGAVYGIELVLLFMTLIAIGPLVRHARDERAHKKIGLAEMPA